MPTANRVLRNFYNDSVRLMQLTEEASKLDDVDDVVVAMATDTNKRLAKQLGLLTLEGKAAGAEDLLIAIRTADSANLERAVKSVEELLSRPPRVSDAAGRTFFSLERALHELPSTNLALVSLPGGQAAPVAMECLKRGLNVHLFSDHVPVRDEISLKRYAHSRGLLLLGPGAGTSIVNGVCLGFANVVSAGKIGIVASAGTGIQEVSVLLDLQGLGVSHALGVGGSDVSSEVGGIMTIDALRSMQDDERTESIVLVAKSPAETVMRKVIRFVEKEVGKPVIACLIGFDGRPGGGIRYAKTLHAAAVQAAGLSGGPKRPDRLSIDFDEISGYSGSVRSKLSKRQRFLRGLYAGGTLAHEARLVLDELDSVASVQTDPEPGRGNVVTDLGDELFTAGRAHPMIDPTIRRVRLVSEARDPSVAVIMFDIILGYGSNDDPGGAMAEAVIEARGILDREGREVAFLAHVCGTASDPQSLIGQMEKLSSARVKLYPSNASMAAAAALIVDGGRARSALKSKWGELFG